MRVLNALFGSADSGSISSATMRTGTGTWITFTSIPSNMAWRCTQGIGHGRALRIVWRGGGMRKAGEVLSLLELLGWIWNEYWWMRCAYPPYRLRVPRGEIQPVSRIRSRPNRISEGKLYAKGRPLVRHAVHLDDAVMFFDDSIADGQSETSSLHVRLG